MNSHADTHKYTHNTHTHTHTNSAIFTITFFSGTVLKREVILNSSSYHSESPRTIKGEPEVNSDELI